MTKDLLSEATRALRETTEASEFEARSTRARVMTGLHQTRVRTRTRWVFLLPIAATFIAVSAWGASNGNARRVVETLENWFFASPPQANAPPRTLPPVNVSAPLNVPVPVPVPVPETLPPVNVPVPVPENLPTLPPQRSASHAEANDPALNLYRAAHAAHFVEHDPVRALAGWDAYLAAAPNGPFAPEARYNRALSLVRLGRNREAQSALEPFARGTYGGYRQAEASALLERLEE